MDYKGTIFEMVEAAARRQRKQQPQAGQRKLKPARKASARTSLRHTAASKKGKRRQGKRETRR